ncbi:MAG: hypothetical protein K940chlam7_00984, partial [Chlamydiae bacterium]|nr:hypothetical protein [Chlamydiota bacterium]
SWGFKSPLSHQQIGYMDCSAYCTASSYKIKSLYQSLKGRYKTTLYRDVVYIEVPSKEWDNLDIFFFPYGAMICWGASLEDGKKFLDEVENFQEQPLKEMEMDDFTYSYGKEFEMMEDEIILPDRNILTKLAISHGLAQSVKLGAFEDTISDSFKKTRHIPENLAKWGKIPLSRRQIRKRMGELFIDRSSINLHVDVLDTPEFFWDHPDLELMYTDIANELDIQTRGQVLNQRLDVIRELFEMLGNELNHQHSSRLEWTIIWLIVIEVVITLLTHYHIV